MLKTLRPTLLSLVLLTAVSQPMVEISIQLMELMLPLLKKKDGSETNHQIVLKTELLIRESSMAKQ